jgi:lysophospholipase L1-like esterase
MFKVKGASTITAKFGQVSRYPDNEDFLMVNEPYMAYSIDGSAFTRVQLDTTNGNSISVPDTNEHFVWIVIDGMDMTTKNGVNRDTGWIGVYIKSLTSNGTMYAVEPKNKQILFVGDSMVEGINTLGTDSKAPSNSAVAEFSFKTAQKLNAIPLLNGYGGSTTWTGVNWVRYSFGTTDTNVTTMTPDLIVIEYGHNDYSVISGGTKTVAEFISEYELLISILRGMYTGTPILCVVPFHQYLRSAIETIVSNTDCCYLIDTSSYSVTYSDGTHPDASGATSIAESLSEDIIKILGKGYFV